MTDLVVAGEQFEAAVLINGVPYVPPPVPPCRHDNFGVDSEVQNMVADPDVPNAQRVGVRVRIRVMCLDCGVPCVFDPGSFLTSADALKAGVWITPQGGW
jgi:hypothetical protein